LQARHWYAEALLKAMLTPTTKQCRLLIGLPEAPRFRSLVERTSEALRRLELGVLFVREDGSIETVPDLSL
jgi:hypothetical protein